MFGGVAVSGQQQDRKGKAGWKGTAVKLSHDLYELIFMLVTDQLCHFHGEGTGTFTGAV